VLRKPGKPNYEVPKVYRPIALLSTMAKVLTGIVAEDMSHHLIGKIKGVWRKGSVVSILFLDIEGAFPNAVTNRLIHNLRRRRIPEQYVRFIKKLLTGRHTKLKFDNQN